jgi:hypothetical protein
MHQFFKKHALRAHSKYADASCRRRWYSFSSTTQSFAAAMSMDDQVCPGECAGVLHFFTKHPRQPESSVGKSIPWHATMTDNNRIPLIFISWMHIYRSDILSMLKRLRHRSVVVINAVVLDCSSCAMFRHWLLETKSTCLDLLQHFPLQLHLHLRPYHHRP